MSPEEREYLDQLLAHYKRASQSAPTTPAALPDLDTTLANLNDLDATLRATPTISSELKLNRKFAYGQFSLR